MADCLVKLGAKYGHFEVNEVLPSLHTVKRKAIQKANEKQKEIMHVLQSALKRNGYIGISTDMWTDYNSRSYFSLTLHFVDENSILHHCVLAVDHFVTRKWVKHPGSHCQVF